MKVASDVRSADFRTRVVRSGESVEVGADRRRKGATSLNGATAEDAVASPPLNVAIVAGGGPAKGSDPTR